jgi:hypothetical protein
LATYWIGIPIEDFRCYANHLFLSSHYMSFILSSFELSYTVISKPKDPRTVSGASGIISLYFPCSTLETLALYRYNSTKGIVSLWVCIDMLNSVSFHRMSTWIILLLNWIPAEIWGNKLLYLSIPCLSK